MHHKWWHVISKRILGWERAWGDLGRWRLNVASAVCVELTEDTGGWGGCPGRRNTSRGGRVWITGHYIDHIDQLDWHGEWLSILQPILRVQVSDSRDSVRKSTTVIVAQVIFPSLGGLEGTLSLGSLSKCMSHWTGRKRLFLKQKENMFILPLVSLFLWLV